MTGGVLAEEGGLNDILKKYGGDIINLTVRNLTQEDKIALLSINFARAEYDEKTNLFRFGSENADETAKQLMKLLSERDMIAESFKIGTATLEEIFRKVAG